ncbi:MAG TPA: sigma-70 family RNA polymerase sigma factor [Candidatus Saccharimonadales bacterium]|nr:sigma-70 family RNA polymerase sigma factor [Candidatus Saccharimonadales bacterium]
MLDRHAEEPSERDLVEGLRRGDPTAFEAIYRTHHRRVYQVAVRVLDNPTVAEDIAQEVFIRAFERGSQFRGDSKLSTWFYRLTVNACLSHLRRKSAVSLDENPLLAETVERAIPAASPLRPALEEAIRSLPPGYRASVVLHDIEGLEHEEIARVLGVSVGTSKSQLHKARAKLRELLAPALEAERRYREETRQP